MHRYKLPCQLGRDTLWLVKIDGKMEVIATGASGNKDGSAQGFFLPGNESYLDLKKIDEVIRQIIVDESASHRPSGFRPAAGSLWLVVVECRYNVVKVSADGNGFFIPGQEPCWLLPHVSEWLEQIFPA